MGKTVLVVAEKPSIAGALASALGHGRHMTRPGAARACVVHEFSGTFRGEHGWKFRVTSVLGHVFSTDFTQQYNNWNAVKPVELFDAEIRKVEADGKSRVVEHLRKEATGADALVLALDCDAEGENICFEVLQVVAQTFSVKPAVDPREYQKYFGRWIFRARFSAVAQKDVLAAMSKLTEPDWNESSSVDARAELDLKVGVAFTRFQTRYFQDRFGNLDSALLSYGPCQTPTLGFCVARHDRIQAFQPQTFWRLALIARSSRNQGHSISLSWERDRIFNKDLCRAIAAEISSSPSATVTSVTEKKGRLSRPKALNTVEMLKMASSRLGMSPHRASHVAESLYTQGLISYPRTESTRYPTTMDLTGMVRDHSRHPYWGSVAVSLLQDHPNIAMPKSGVDVGDHPPITPVRCSDEREVGSSEHWRLYELIVRHFLATVSPDATYIQKRATVTTRAGDERFLVSGRVVVNPGWTSVTGTAGLSDEPFPDLQKGDELDIAKVDIDESETSPPGYLTESELIGLMEKHGIGTDASIPTHINNIEARNYVKISSGSGGARRVVPTPLGIVLCHGYHRIDPDLVLPKIRAHIEKEIKRVAKGEAACADVIFNALSNFKAKFQYFERKMGMMDELFEATFSSLADSGKILSRCGRCRRYAKFLPLKPTRLHWWFNQAVL
uniref:DNA topoisomerase n=1 Tax=Compsopogon caeruleus TaxID=31354 RepID=A0A7S1THE9_9RHOD|mmetsp:Transcript_6245/g.12354  ORF Transcript_6245/g.12354 Transcript_6245/m.12354 type:complete len:671 (+) Transcript_6245:2438-4450(+)